MKGQTNTSRSPQRAARRPTQTAPLTRLVVLDALRGWAVPTLAAVVGFGIFVLYNVNVVGEAVAVTTVGVAALVTVLFFGLRGFLDHRHDSVTTAVLVGFAVLWLLASLYPFCRAINPGVPAFSTELSRGGVSVTVPLKERPGRYDLII